MDKATQTVTTSAIHIVYEQTGPDSGEPILLLHGFPYDVRAYDRVLGLLEEKNRRLIVPYLRGFGPTRYRSPETLCSGQQAALGKDIVDLLDALKIKRATLVGYDWGGRAACVAAALWPQRVRALVSAGGYSRVSSTRRLRARPASVSLVSTGRDAPKPSVERRSAAT
jgi:pimeloyl-ACP methyl ester carboxylesterase